MEMNKLMQQVKQPDQIRGRESRLKVDWAHRKIAYKAPNEMVFIIDTKPTETGGEPIVLNQVAKSLGISHRTHSLGDGRVCLADNLRGWDLTKILLQCDSWACGYEIYKKTGTFPSSPKAAFRRTPHSNNKEKPSLLARLFS